MKRGVVSTAASAGDKSSPGGSGLPKRGDPGALSFPLRGAAPAEDASSDDDSLPAAAAAKPSIEAALADPSAFPLELLRKLYPRAPGAGADSDDSDSDADAAPTAAALTGSGAEPVAEAELTYRAAPVSSSGLTRRMAPPSALLGRLGAFMPHLANPTAGVVPVDPVRAAPASTAAAGSGTNGFELSTAAARARVAAGAEVIQMTLALGVLEEQAPARAPVSMLGDGDSGEAGTTAAASADESVGGLRTSACSSAGTGARSVAVPAAFARALGGGAAAAADDDDDDDDDDDSAVVRAAAAGDSTTADVEARLRGLLFSGAEDDDDEDDNGDGEQGHEGGVVVQDVVADAPETAAEAAARLHARTGLKPVTQDNNGGWTVAE
jgi:hypothetical protein